MTAAVNPFKLAAQLKKVAAIVNVLSAAGITADQVAKDFDEREWTRAAEAARTHPASAEVRQMVIAALRERETLAVKFAPKPRLRVVGRGQQVFRSFGMSIAYNLNPDGTSNCPECGTVTDEEGAEMLSFPFCEACYLARFGADSLTSFEKQA